MAAPSDVNKGDVKTEWAIQQRTGTESVMTQRSQSGVMGSSPVMQMPVFEYSQPGPYFKQFRRYVRVLGIDVVKVHDLLCYSLGAGARSQWLADLVEESVVPGEGDSAEAVVERVEELVLKALQTIGRYPPLMCPCPVFPSPLPCRPFGTARDQCVYCIRAAGFPKCFSMTCLFVLFVCFFLFTTSSTL